MSLSARPSSSTRSAGRHHHHPAEKTGRRARELDPKYVDVAVRRWEHYTGKTAVLDGTGQTFDDMEAARTAANDSAAARKEVA